MKMVLFGCAVLCATLPAAMAKTATIAESSCRVATDRAMSMVNGMWDSDDRDKIFFGMKFSQSDGIGGAMLFMIMQMRSDKVLRNMTTEERWESAYRICLEVYTPYYRLGGKAN